MFKQGQVLESFEQIETQLLEGSRKRLEQGKENASFEVLESLIVLARLRMEIGEFIKADKALSEVKEILTKGGLDNEERVVYYWAKYYTINSKNLARQMYQQRAYEVMNEGIAYLKQGTDYQRIKVKFTCKLNESLCSLVCEPLIFEEAEKYLQTAEDIVKKNPEHFSPHDVIKQQFKRASFEKRYGFFNTSIAIVEKIQKDLMEMLKHPKDAKEAYDSKKLLFKVYRDMARLAALQRQEQKAADCHKKAERILKEELISHSSGKKSLNQSMRMEVGVKIAKLQFLKGLWTSKFDYERSVEEMIEAYHQFAEVLGDEQNYFSSQCQLEVGSSYLRLKEVGNCSVFLNQAVETVEKMFGEDHPLIQRYYSHAMDMQQQSQGAENNDLMELAQKNYDTVERCNRLSDPNAPQSLFILDALMHVISCQAQINTVGILNQKIQDNVLKMETIYGENGIIGGSQMLHSVYTMQAMSMIREERVLQALAILQETYDNQVQKLRGDKSHPFVEQCLSQLAMMLRLQKKYAESEEAYKNYAILKENYYGEQSESLIFALKNLSAVQAQQGKILEAVQNSERALGIINKLLDSGKMKDKTEFKKHSMEVVFMLVSFYEGQKKFNLSQDKSDEYEQTFKRLIDGENTIQYGYFQFLKARQMMMNQDVDQNLTLQLIQKAIDIQSEIEKISPLKSPQLGRYYYFQGTVYKSLQQLTEQLRCFKIARKIMIEHPEYVDLTNELEKHIKAIKTELGIEGESDEGQEEEQEEEDGTKAESSDFKDTVIVASIGAALVFSAIALFMRFRR